MGMITKKLMEKSGKSGNDSSNNSIEKVGISLKPASQQNNNDSNCCPFYL